MTVRCPLHRADCGDPHCETHGLIVHISNPGDDNSWVRERFVPAWPPDVAVPLRPLPPR